MRVERRLLTLVRRRRGSRQYVMSVPRGFAEGRREVILIYDKDYMIVVPSEAVLDSGVCEVLYRLLGVAARDC